MGGRDELIGHAFISYVHEDSHWVNQLQHMLEAAGIPVWRDTADLWPGEDWRAKIRHAITDNALVFLACFSQVSLSRAKSYQKEELLLAIEQLRLRRPDDPWLIPVRFDECDIPELDIGLGRTLASIQRADLFGDRSEEGARRLVESVLRILRHTSHTAVAWPQPEAGPAFESRIAEVPVVTSTTSEYNNIPEAALQARLVNAWCDDVRPASQDGQHLVTVTVQNSSDDPVYRLRIAVGAGWSRDVTRYSKLDLLVVLPPRSRQQRTVAMHLNPLSGEDYDSLPPVEMIFSDVTGRFWRRDGYGGLAQISDIRPSSASEWFFKELE